MPPTLSVCIMVKDEEQNLPQFLNQLGNDTDAEIIVGDTGSTDRTVEVSKAISKDIRIVSIRWENHFANARNELANAAIGKWIFWADGDFQCTKSFLANAIRACKEAADKVDSLIVTLQCYRLSTNYQIMTPRIIRSDIRMIGRVHETPNCKHSKLTSLKLTESRGESKESIDAKNRKYETLLLQEVAENPQNFGPYMYLLKTALARNDWRNARQLLDQKPVWTGFDFGIITRFLIRLGRPKYEIKRSIEAAILLSPLDISLWTLWGDIYTDDGDYTNALACYEEAINFSLEDQVRSGLFLIEEEIFLLPRMNRASLLAEMGRVKEARTALLECVKHFPNSPQKSIIERNLIKLH